MKKQRIAVVGGGWSGIAAAMALTESGTAHHAVTVFEAGRTLGGRARSFWVDTPQGRLCLDHGQHILMGAYRSVRALWRSMGLDESQLVERRPLTLWIERRAVSAEAEAVQLALPREGGRLWRWLWAAWRAHIGLRGERAALMRAVWALLTWWRRGGVDTMTVAAWLRHCRQPESLVESVWRPLVLAAMNTPLEVASMRVFACVLRDSMWRRGEDSDWLFPKRPLFQLCAEPAKTALQARGVACRLGTRVRSLYECADGVDIDGERFDRVIVAVAPQHLATVLPSFSATGWQYFPIATAYFYYADLPTLPYVMCGLAGRVGQWVFDRQALYGERGMLSVVMSVVPLECLRDREVLAVQLAREIQQVFGGGLPTWQRVVIEHRATFACTATYERPDMRVSERIYLAGDYMWPDYPATLESAVRSGQAAAHQVLADCECLFS